MDTKQNQDNFCEGDASLLGGFINTAKAKQLLNCKSTKLYYLRKRGELIYSSIGNTIFYELNSIKRLIERNRSDSTPA